MAKFKTTGSGLQIPLERTGGRAVLEEGIYALRIESIEEKVGPSGNPYLNLTMIVLDKSGRPSNTKIWDILSLAPKARFKIDQVLDALEAPEEGSVGPKWFVNKRLWAVLTTDTYKGTTKNVVDRYLLKEVAEESLRKGAEEAGESFTQIDMSSNGTDEPDDEDWEEPAPIVEKLPDELKEDDDIPF
jgi:hypothetical protein